MGINFVLKSKCPLKQDSHSSQIRCKRVVCVGNQPIFLQKMHYNILLVFPYPITSIVKHLIYYIIPSN